MLKEISKWPRRNGLSARKRQRPMSLDLGLLTLTPQKGDCARAASQAVLKELLGKGLARRGVSGCVASAGQALWGLACLRALPETPRRCHHFGNSFRYLLSRRTSGRNCRKRPQYKKSGRSSERPLISMSNSRCSDIARGDRRGELGRANEGSGAILSNSSAPRSHRSRNCFRSP